MESSESPSDSETPSELTAEITSPGNKSAIDEGAELTLEGTGADPENGELSGNALRWTSDVDGQLGTGQSLSVSSLSSGPHTITLEVTDSDGNTASDAAVIVVESPGFNIRLVFGSDFTTSQKTTIRDALNPWEEAIKNDLQAVFPPSEVVDNCELEEKAIDDLVLGVVKSDIDGSSGTLAQAAPCVSRTDSEGNLTTSGSGIIMIDKADQDNPDLKQIVTHEVGHALGIGVEQIQGWGSNLNGSGTRDPFHTGPNTTSAFQKLEDEAYLSEGVPVANTGGAGTAGAHWREANFETELMTGNINPGVDMPLSRVSLAALQDIGYPVDLNAADSFTLPMPQLALWLAEADATVSGPASSGENFGQPTDGKLGSALVAGSNNKNLWSSDPEDELFASFVRFDVPTSVPTGVTIEKAEIRFIVNERDAETTNHNVEILPVADSWSEETVTLDNSPGVGSAVETFDFQSCEGCVRDLTTLATDWAEGNIPNNGVALRAPDAASDPTFSVGYFSRHADSPRRRPIVGVTAKTSTSALTEKTSDGEKIPLGDDILKGRIYGVGSGGKVVRTKRIGE